MKVNLQNGQQALVDDEEWEWVKIHNWYVMPNGYVRTYTSKKKTGLRVGMLLHRYILRLPKGHIDHINGNPLDNRKCNLRVCTMSQNMMNKRKSTGKSSQYKGVSWNKKAEKWIVFIQKDKKRGYVGSFLSEQEAALAYNAAAIKEFGEFARLNHIA